MSTNATEITRPDWKGFFAQMEEIAADYGIAPLDVAVLRSLRFSPAYADALVKANPDAYKDTVVNPRLRLSDTALNTPAER